MENESDGGAASQWTEEEEVSSLVHLLRREKRGSLWIADHIWAVHDDGQGTDREVIKEFAFVR